MEPLALFHALAQIAEALEHVRNECGKGPMYDALDVLVLRLDQVIDEVVDGRLVPGEEDDA